MGASASREDFLEQCPWTRQLAPEHGRKARDALVVRTFAAGAYICRKGEVADAWVGVMEGFVKLSTQSASGKTVTFAGIPAGSWFGEGSVLKREIRRYDTIALRD